ncbi:hypothetical protein MMC31_003490 [Peltigera leucophlebia]|nr:hypothetical protein [Peltigera leucophlebia]
MNRASYAEQAVKEMATENAGPLGTFSKNSPQQAGYRGTLNPTSPVHATLNLCLYIDPNYPSHSPQYSPNSPGPPHYTISEMETNPANALSSNPRLRDSASSYLHPFPTPHPAYPMDTGYGLPVSPITPTTPSPHYFPTPSTPHPLSNLSSNEQSLSATVETSGEQSNASAAGRAQRLASAIRGLQQEVGEPSWELSSTNSVRRGGARGVNTDVSDWPAPAPPTHNQEAPSYPPRPPTMQPPVAGI